MPALARLSQADPIEKLIKPANLKLGQNKGPVMLTGAAKPAGDTFDFSATDVARTSTALADTVHDFKKKQVESMSKSDKKAGELGKPLSGDIRPDLPTPPAVKDPADYLKTKTRTAEQWDTEPVKPGLQDDREIKLAGTSLTNTPTPIRQFIATKSTSTSTPSAVRTSTFDSRKKR